MNPVTLCLTVPVSNYSTVCFYRVCTRHTVSAPVHFLFVYSTVSGVISFEYMNLSK